MNKVILIGRITKDPQLQQSSKSTEFVVFSIAVDRNYKDENGNKIADFINCIAFKNTANYLNNYVKKGYLISVEGKIQTRNYQASDGQIRYITEVVCDNVSILQSKKESSFENRYDNVDEAYGINNQTLSFDSNDDYDMIEDDDLPF